MKTIKGSRFADRLEASKVQSTKLLGLKGNDTLIAFSDSKKNILDGGLGDDYLISEISTIKAIGGKGNDEIDAFRGIANDAIISGGEGNDYIRLGFRDNSPRRINGWRINAGSGDDIIEYLGIDNSRSTSNTKILGGSGDDYISATISYNDTTKIYAGKGNDNIQLNSVPEARKTFIYGGSGKDTLTLFNTPKISGNSENATLTFSSYMLNGKGYQQKVYLSSIEVLVVSGETIFL